MKVIDGDPDDEDALDEAGEGESCGGAAPGGGHGTGLVGVTGGGGRGGWRAGGDGGGGGRHRGSFSPGSAAARYDVAALTALGRGEESAQVDC